MCNQQKIKQPAIFRGSSGGLGHSVVWKLIKSEFQTTNNLYRFWEASSNHLLIRNHYNLPPFYKRKHSFNILINISSSFPAPSRTFQRRNALPIPQGVAMRNLWFEKARILGSKIPVEIHTNEGFPMLDSRILKARISLDIQNPPSPSAELPRNPANYDVLLFLSSRTLFFCVWIWSISMRDVKLIITRQSGVATRST